MTIRTHVFAGQRYAVRSQSGLRPPDLAACDYERKTIRIPMEGDTRDELDAIIHEALHAACPWMAEDNVNDAATAAAGLLWRLGWRRE